MGLQSRQNHLSEFEAILKELGINPIKPFKGLLRKKKVSGRQLSVKSGIPQQTISSWSSGANDIKKASFEYIIKVADILEMTVEELWEELNG